jgi:general secretion pathway protein G
MNMEMLLSHPEDDQVYRTAKYLPNRQHRRRPDGGFTLIELMIIMLILAILAAIAVLAVDNAQAQSAVAACKADYKTVETAQEAYRAQVGKSASGFGDLTVTTTGATGSQVGPWLKEAPSSTHGYVLGFDSMSGDITVASSNPVHQAQVGDGNCDFA